MTARLKLLGVLICAVMAGCASAGHAQTGSTTCVSSASQCYYGPGIGADALSNTVVGTQYNLAVSYRLRAHHTGALQSINVYLIPDRTGYASGTGGEIRVTINTDDGTTAHNPSSTVLASYLITNYSNLTPSRYFPVLTFPVPPNLVDGQLYHVVFTNVDANPSVNYMSVDALYNATFPTPTQPTISDTDSAVLLYQPGQPWKLQKGNTPIVQLTYTDGWTGGVGYMEVWPDSPQTVSGSSTVRETLTVTGTSRTVASVSVRGVRLSGNDPLIVRLENADGTLIEQGNIPATSIPTGPSLSLNYAYGSPYAWATYTFSSAHTLTAGQTYHLDLEATSTSAYQFFPVRKGMAYGFQSTTYFVDGYAQFKQNGNWNGWTEWGVANRTDGDLQFYFTLSGTSSSATSSATSSPAPTISGASAATSASATITWTTDQPSTSQLQFGTTTAYASVTPLNPALVTNHSVTVNGLTGGTVYHYRILSTNASGSQSISGDLTFSVP